MSKLKKFASKHVSDLSVMQEILPVTLGLIFGVLALIGLRELFVELSKATSKAR